jgi:voltage-gated potassium channel
MRESPGIIARERLLMSPRRRLIYIAIALLAVIAVGTIGYKVIGGEEWSFLDAIYMTVITLSTVGFKEVHELSDTGKVFTIVLVIGGVGVMLYSLANIFQFFIEGQLTDIFERRRMKDNIAKLKGQIIVCGYGQVGQEVALTLRSEGVPFVIVDQSPEAIAEATRDGHLCVQGDATKDDVLTESGIQQARGLVAAVGSDADNIFITLSAKGLKPGLLVVARAFAEESESKLKRAGADRVILPLRLGGKRMAMIALHPLVIDFVETTIHSRDREFVLEDIKIASDSPVAGMTIKQGQEFSGGASILAVRKKGGALLANPPQETRLEQEDEMVVMGTRQQLRTLEQIEHRL